METLFAEFTISMSEFKKNPASVLRRAHNRPVAVLNHNRASFYLLEPRLFEALLAELADAGPGRSTQKLIRTNASLRHAMARLSEIADAAHIVQRDLTDN